jgi:hypothetical protein
MTLRPLGLALASAAAAVALGLLSPAVAHADSADQCIAAAEQSQPLRQDGKLRAAREKLIACSRPDCPSVVRTDCTKWMADLDALMPTVVVRAVDSTGADVAGVRVSVDGEVLAALPEGREIEIDPGTHALRFEHEGYAAVDQQIVVRESERHRILSVSFAAGSAPSAAAPSSLAGASSPTSPGGEVAPAGRSRVLPIVLVGAGAVGLGVASYFWIAGLSDRSNLASSCAKGATAANPGNCLQSDIDSAHGKLVVGDVVGGIGIAAAAVGVGLLLFGSSGGSGTEAAAPVAVDLGPRGGSLQIRGRF